MNYLLLLIKARKITLLIISVICAGISANAQYKENSEIGFIGGVSYYLGDLNTTHFSQSSLAGGLTLRKNIDRRFSYKANALILPVNYDERKSEDTIAVDRGLHFRSPIYELSGQIEFNFLPYETGNPLYTWTPFVYTGVSIFNYNPQAENKNGEWVDLQPLGTEGQGTTTYPERKPYSLIQFAIPIGGGLKIAINESFNIILEYGIRKTFSDYIDDVSTDFVGGPQYPLEMSEDAIEMSDPLMTHTKGQERGNPNKKDWYSFAGLTLSFKINNNSKGCDY
tara:strand:+ start:722 stop:1564 length:843 start_codon:yes stop_codon:yes gene_type:complete